MAAKKAAKRRSGKKKATTKKKAARKKAAAKRPSAHKVRSGVITHTELASTNPDATVAWAKAALGWKFGKPTPTPAGPYHMWNFGDNTGGGVRATGPGEKAGTVPYCEVPSATAAVDKAVKAGATVIMPPDEIPGGMGWIAIVTAPGGVPIGFWAPKK